MKHISLGAPGVLGGEKELVAMSLKVGDTDEAVVVENINRTHIVKYAAGERRLQPAAPR